jgi:hypothetical protein
MVVVVVVVVRFAELSPERDRQLESRRHDHEAAVGGRHRLRCVYRGGIHPEDERQPPSAQPPRRLGPVGYLADAAPPDRPARLQPPRHELTSP